jgi:hypothetical protein
LYPSDELAVARSGHARRVGDIAEASGRVAEGVERGRGQQVAGR